MLNRKARSAIILSVGTFVVSWLEASVLASASRPNIVFIISDDQGYGDFGFMGNTKVRTPNLDELASEAAVYPNSYVPTSCCRPSLATFLTGLYPHEHCVHFNHPPPGYAPMIEYSVAEWKQCRATGEELIRRVPTLPRTLAQHGYVCLQTGKHWEGDYRNSGFTHGMTLNEPSAEPAYGNRMLKDGWVAHGNGDAGLNIGRDTMQPIFDFIDRYAGSTPFFIWYSPFMPHIPFDAGQEYRRHFENRDDIDDNLVSYYSEIARFDETVGQLIGYIEQKKIAQDTLFVFAVDNGFRPASSAGVDPRMHPADNRSKLTAYENGIRTPIVIRWDGHTKTATHERLTQSVDIIPTILAAAGLPNAMGELPGVDLLPSATGQAVQPSRPAFGEIYADNASSLDNPSADVVLRWIRDGDYKLVVPEASQGKLEIALYDLATDPGEHHNIAKQPEQVQRVRNLTKLLDEWWTPNSRPVDAAADRKNVSSDAE